jgi:ABC-type molybdate transport system permease subunit
MAITIDLWLAVSIALATMLVALLIGISIGASLARPDRTIGGGRYR